MLTLLYSQDNRAGKKALYSQIEGSLAKGRRTVLFVPEQQVLEAEGMMVSLDREHLGEVTSFRRMANSIFRLYGGLRYQTLGAGAKQIVLWRAVLSVSEHLTEYGKISLDDMSTVRLLYDTVEEMKLYRILPEQIDFAAQNCDDKKLSDKLSDIALIYSTYQTLLAEEFDDDGDDVLRAAKLADGKGVFQKCDIYFDSFDGFTPIEQELLRVIFAEAADVTVFLAFPKKDSRKIFLKLRETDQKLRTLAKATGLSVSETFVDDETGEKELLFFRNNYAHRLPEPFGTAEKSGAVRGIACPGIYEEARFVAADIKKRVMAGARYRDFAIVTRDTDRYFGILDAALEGAKIPYFVSVRKDVSGMTLSRMLLSVLDIHARHFRKEDVVAFMRTGLSPLSSDECDAVEEYAETWRITGSRWYDDNGWQMNPFGYSVEFDDKARKRLVYLNALREKLILPLTKLFEAFEGHSSVRAISTALVHFLKEMQIGQKIKAREALDRTFGEVGLGYEDHALLHEVLMRIFDELVCVAGDVKVTSREYSRLLTTLFKEADIGALPSRLDEVTVGEASLFRKHGVKHLYLIGMTEGDFPKAIADGGCFDNEEKEAMIALGIEASPIASRRAEDEKLYFYRAMASAEESVTMSYAYGDLSGHEAFPSSAFLDTLMLLGEREAESYDDLPIGDLLYGTPEILEYAVLHRYDTEALGLVGVAKSALERDLTAKEESLSVQVTDRLYDDKIVLTQSKTDLFSRCPFAYHCKYTLKLSEGVSGSFESLDIGIFIHAILEKFFSHFKERVREADDDEIKQVLEEILTETIKELVRDNTSRRFLSLVSRLKRTAEMLVMNLIAEFRQSRFIPVLFEEDVSYSEETKVEELGRNLTVMMRGKVDRVDLYRGEKNTYLRVVDYKTGTKKFSMSQVDKGFELQLLLYLFALTQGNAEIVKEKLTAEGDLLAAGALYFSLGSKVADVEKCPETKEIAREKIEKEILRSGIFLNLPDVLEAMEEKLSGCYIPIKLNKDASFKCTGGSELYTLEEMGVLAEKLSKILANIAKQMRIGTAAAKPQTAEKNTDPCQYCKMKPICRVKYQKEETEEGGND